MFELGQIVTTRRIASTLDVDLVLALISRHHQGDWGDICDEDKQLNQQALTKKDRILSVFKVGHDRVYIMTEWDRSVTTVLYSDEY